MVETNKLLPSEFHEENVEDLEKMNAKKSAVILSDRAYSSLTTSTSTSTSASSLKVATCININTSSKENQPSYFATNLPKEMVVCILFCIFGMYSPSTIIRPIFGINIRPIPYQVLPSNNDVVLDLSLNHELVENATVNSSLLLQSSITVPILLLAFITSVFAPRIKPKYHDAHSSICVLLTTIGMSEFITQIVKFYVGRLRPNFYSLCGFDTNTLSCTNPIEMEIEGRCSFPSGHSSLSTSGMSVLAYFFLGRVGMATIFAIGASGGGSKQNNISTKVKAFLALLPMTFSTFCACSRLFDNWHHPSDVLAGICLGLFCSTFCYHLWYPPIFSENYAGVPLSYVYTLNNKDVVD